MLSICLGLYMPCGAYVPSPLGVLLQSHCCLSDCGLKLLNYSAFTSYFHYYHYPLLPLPTETLRQLVKAIYYLLVA
jgi:hypothetical protein